VPALAELMAAAAGAYGGLVDAVVPVPLHRRRLAERGFNQAVVIARPLARALGVPLVVGRLVRVRPTRPQVGLDAEARERNVRGAFRVRRAVSGRVLLVDDVWTTGATLAEAARVLVDGGADVRTLTLARAPGR
jgi:ComF family protein